MYIYDTFVKQQLENKDNFPQHITSVNKAIIFPVDKGHTIITSEQDRTPSIGVYRNPHTQTNT